MCKNSRLLCVIQLNLIVSWRVIMTLNVPLLVLDFSWQVFLQGKRVWTWKFRYHLMFIFMINIWNGANFPLHWKVSMISKSIWYLFKTINTFNYLDFEWKNKLRFVRIYFDTPTFDRITKDKSAKFVDMLSAIGGTMGLLTGFSIISGVEILYFIGKIIFNCLKNKTLF